MLRTVFRWEKMEKPVQVILKEHEIPLEYYNKGARQEYFLKINYLAPYPREFLNAINALK